ncbi:hypothetical protein ACT7CV_16480 [Bacillus paranthracis]
MLLKKVPKDFYLWDINKAEEWLKNEMHGDLSYDTTLKAWVCNVVKREVNNFQSQNKTVRPRLIPNFFSQQELTNLLLEHIKERQLVMEETGQEHDYLFYSTSNNSKGEEITGGRFILSTAALFLVLKRRFLSQLFSTFIPAFFCNSLNPN